MNSDYEAGYTHIIKLAMSKKLMVGGALAGAAGAMGVRKVMTDKGYVPSLVPSFTSDPTEFATGYYKPGMVRKGISRLSTGRSAVDNAKDPIDYAASGVVGGLVGGMTLPAAAAMLGKLR